MLENGLSLKTRPPDDCFDANGQLKASEVPGGSAVAASAALAGGVKMNAGKIKLMMNLRDMMNGEEAAEGGGEGTALSDAAARAAVQEGAEG